MQASGLIGRRRPSRMPAKPHKKAGYWYLVRRTPIAYRGVDKRSIVRLSTGIRVVDDPQCRSAQVAVGYLDQALSAYWRDLRAGKDVDAVRRLYRLRARAQELGFSYQSLSAVAVLPLRELGARLEMLLCARLLHRREDVYAILGGEPEPRCCSTAMPISEIVNELESISSTALAAKSLRQRRRWRTTRARALHSLMEAVGADKCINSLSRQDILAFRQRWQDRVLLGEVQIASANKAIGTVASMYRTISDHHQLDLPPVFERVWLRGEDAGQRIAFESWFI